MRVVAAFERNRPVWGCKIFRHRVRRSRRRLPARRAWSQRATSPASLSAGARPSSSSGTLPVLRPSARRKHRVRCAAGTRPGQRANGDSRRIRAVAWRSVAWPSACGAARPTKASRPPRRPRGL